jgi:hypothetical protein
MVIIERQSGFTRMQESKVTSWHNFMLCKNIERVCFECGNDLSDTEGRGTPLCSRCSQLVRLGYRR